MGSVLDSIRSVQETVERIAKQTGTEHLFGNIGYILGLEDIDGKSKSQSTEKTQKADTANTSDVVVDAPNTSKSQPESKSVADTIREILARVDKIALESGTEHLFENLDEILGIKREVKGENAQNQLPPEFEQEDFFISKGTIQKTRSYQTLHYGKDTYGMECNACCVMYLLQNYGLLPIKIPRKSFEYLFTVLNPAKELASFSENKDTKSKEGILLNSQRVKPYQADLFKNLFEDSGKFLRGFKYGGGAIIPNSGNSASNLFEIMQRFYALSFKKGYEFLQKYHNPSLNSLFYDDVGASPITNRYQDLLDGTLSQEYFGLGNTVFVGVDYDGEQVGHYSIVTAPKIATINIDNVNYHFYPADDPLNGVVYAVVPYVAPIKEKALQQEFRDYSGYKRALISIISPNSAMGV